MNTMEKFVEWIKLNASTFNECESENQNELIQASMRPIAINGIEEDTIESFVLFNDEIQNIPHSYMFNINGAKEFICTDCCVKDNDDIIVSIIEDEETLVPVEGRIIINKNNIQVIIGFYAPLDEEKNEWKFYARSETYINNGSDDFQYQSELEDKITDTWEKQIHKAVPKVDVEAIKDSKFDDCF